MRPIRIAIVNDYAIVVAGTAALLEPFADRVEVVELDAGLPVKSDVDVVLYDTFGQVQGNGIDMEELVEGGPAKVMVFTWNVEPELVRASTAHGVAGYVSKSVTADELVDAIERVHRGEQVMPPDESSGDEIGRWPGDGVGLSARESEVLALICQGLSNQQITEHAYIGINTVKTHIRSLYRKLGVSRRSQAVIWGLANGFEPDHHRHVL
ncbi:MAG: response regulator transcription factor [Nocardioides sp.]